jgi:hypothetical protein
MIKKLQAPKHEKQTLTKYQIPMSQTRFMLIKAGELQFNANDVVFVLNLNIVAWDLLVIWYLRFGMYFLSLVLNTIFIQSD